MDKFSFLNSAHTSFFAEMYDQYLESPDSLEPSWKAFFQGFDFGLENANITVEEKKFEVPENIKQEFKVVNLINAYRQRGHLFTITNPVRERRKYSPTLDIENFGLKESDLELVFSAGEIVGIGPSKLKAIIDKLKELEFNGYEYESADASLRLLLDKFTGKHNSHFEFEGYRVIVEKRSPDEPTTSEATIKVNVDGEPHYTVAQSSGPVGALDSACLLYTSPSPRD